MDAEKPSEASTPPILSPPKPDRQDLQPPPISEFWAWLIFHFTKDWRNILKYPIALFAICVSVVFVAWFLTWNVVVPEKDQQLTTKQGQIDFLNEKMDDLQRENDRLRNDNERLQANVAKPLADSVAVTNMPQPKSIVKWQPPQMTNLVINAVFTVGGGTSPFSLPIYGGTNYEMEIYRVSNHRAITAHIFDRRAYINLNVPTGKLPIEIRDGKSTPLPEGWDWNSDSNALEIVDDRGEAVLQEQYISPTVIQINGEIQVGDQIFLTDRNMGFEQPFPPALFHPENDNLVTMFEYPSSNHLGQRIP